MALLRLPPKKWTEYLKEMGHRFPKTALEYKTMQDAIVREKTLESQVGSLSNQGGNVLGQIGGNTYFGASAQADVPSQYGSGSAQAVMDWLPLYLCLGNPTETGMSRSNVTNTFAAIEDRTVDTTVTLLNLDAIGDSGSDYSDDQTWARENVEDPYSDSRLAELRQQAQGDPLFLGNLYWASRLATRELRAARGKFGPRARYAPLKVAKLYTKRGPSNRQGAPTRSRTCAVRTYAAPLRHRQALDEKDDPRRCFPCVQEERKSHGRRGERPGSRAASGASPARRDWPRAPRSSCRTRAASLLSPSPSQPNNRRWRPDWSERTCDAREKCDSPTSSDAGNAPDLKPYLRLVPFFFFVDDLQSHALMTTC